MMVDGDDGSCHCKNIDAGVCWRRRLPWFVCFLAIERLDLLPYHDEI